MKSKQELLDDIQELLDSVPIKPVSSQWAVDELCKNMREYLKEDSENQIGPYNDGG